MPDTVLSPIYSARRKWLCADCHCWCGLASSRWRRSPTSSELAQKRGKRGNIATALAFERANFPDGDDSRLGLTAAYVATSGLTSQGPLPPPCSAGRSSRDPVSSPAFRSDIGTWAGGTPPPALFTLCVRAVRSLVRERRLCLLLLQRRLPFALGCKSRAKAKRRYDLLNQMSHATQPA